MVVMLISSRALRSLALVLLVAAALSVGFWYLGVWAVGQTFQESGLDGLSSLLEAAVGGSLANRSGHLQPSQGMRDQGVIAFYRRHPDKLKEDRAYFRTWVAALAVGNSALEYNGMVQWQDSEAFDRISSAERHDAWGHLFCVMANKGIAIVVSPGPDALSSLRCDELRISKAELESLPHARLNKHPSGALILVLTTSNQTDR